MGSCSQFLAVRTASPLLLNSIKRGRSLGLRLSISDPKAMNNRYVFHSGFAPRGTSSALGHTNNRPFRQANHSRAHDTEPESVIVDQRYEQSHHQNSNRPSIRHPSGSSRHTRHRSSGQSHRSKPRTDERERILVRPRNGQQIRNEHRSTAPPSVSTASPHTATDTVSYEETDPRSRFDEQEELDGQEDFNEQGVLRFNVSDSSSSATFVDDSAQPCSRRSSSDYCPRSSHNDGNHRRYASVSRSRTSSTPHRANGSNVSESGRSERHRRRESRPSQELERYRREEVSDDESDDSSITVWIPETYTPDAQNEFYRRGESSSGPRQRQRRHPGNDSPSGNSSRTKKYPSLNERYRLYQRGLAAGFTANGPFK